MEIKKNEKKLETWFTYRDVDEIHTLLVNYDVLVMEEMTNNQELAEEIQTEVDERWETTIKNKERLGDNNLQLSKNKPTVEIELSKYQKVYDSIILLNKNIVTEYSKIIKAKISQQLEEIPDAIDRLNFIFDFVTNYVSYSKDYVSFCREGVGNVGNSEKYTFDFNKDLIPVDHSVDGTLVFRQGTSEEITKLIYELSIIADLKVGRSPVIKGYNNYYVNNVKAYDNSITFIDATAFIAQGKTKQETFLVSLKELKQNRVTFEPNPKNDSYDYDRDMHYKAMQLIGEIEQLLPDVSNLYYESKYHQAK